MMTELEQEIAHLQKLRAKHRKNIHRLKETLANYGIDRPLHLLNELEFEQEQLRLVEERLVELAAQVRTEEVPSAPAEPPRLPRQVPPRVTVPEPKMILIPAGEFLMGSDPSVDKDAWDNEQPQHTLYLLDYYLAKTPVTNAQYAAFVQATDYRQPKHWEDEKPPKDKEDHPVVWITWYDAMAYCYWLAEATGKLYSLPSEAEWEKGARGSDGRIYPWGDRWDAEQCNSRENGREDTTPAGAYPQGASPYGLLDMAGNVWEWTRSLDKDYPYVLADSRENLEAESPRVLRGGAFSDPHRNVRCARRFMSYPYDRNGYRGFRVEVSPVSPLDWEV